MSESEPNKYVIGTLSTGATVTYTPAFEQEKANEKQTGVRVSVPEPFKYVISGDDYEEEFTVERSGYGEPEKPLDDVISHFESEYGWQSLTAEAHIAAYGTILNLGGWPDETPDGDPLVGLVEETVIPDWTIHGNHVGLYLTGGQLEPYVVKPSPFPRESTREIDNPQAIPLPESDLKDKHTYNIPDGESVEDIVGAFEEEEKWSIDGYPHELNPHETVSGQRVQVTGEFTDALQYPRYWVDSGGQKHRIA